MACTQEVGTTSREGCQEISLPRPTLGIHVVGRHNIKHHTWIDEAKELHSRRLFQLSVSRQINNNNSNSKRISKGRGISGIIHHKEILLHQIP